MTLKSMKLLPLLCLCLLTLSGKTFADEHSPAIIKVKEGSDVILPCSLSNKDIERERFEWKKDGQKEVFFYDGGLVDQQLEGRVSHFSDELQSGKASIIIRNTKVTDSGHYTCDFPDLQQRQIFNIELVVEPVIIKVKEDSDVILPCFLSTKENIEYKLFDWKKDDELKDGNASIIIRNTKVTDSGDYTCVFPLLQPRQIFHIQLVVGSSTGWIVPLLGAALCAVAVAVLAVCVGRKCSQKLQREPKTSDEILDKMTLLQSKEIKDNASGQEDHVSHFPDEV